MKRSPLTRKTGLTRKTALRQGGTLERRTELKKGKRSRGVPKNIYAEVLLRDGGCRAARLVPAVRCYGRIDPHHVLMKSQGGQDTAENLISVCRAHHDYIHANPAVSYGLGLLRHPDRSTNQTKGI